jgi:hypothetical protein
MTGQHGADASNPHPCYNLARNYGGA